MNLFDELKGAVFEAAEGTAQSMLAKAVEGGLPGGLGGLLGQLQGSGLGEQVSSWLAPGGNLPISADQLRAVLGNEQLQQIGDNLGLPMDKISEMLAEHLPGIASSQNG